MSKDLQPIESQFLMYTSPMGVVKIQVLLQGESIWLTQAKIASLFGVQVPAISKHLSNIFDEGELVQVSVISILETTASDGKIYKTKYYNLDAIIAVGYRVNSYEATQFRIWATQVLRQHILNGYTINSARIADNYTKFLEAVSNTKSLISKESRVGPVEAIDLVTLFAHTWFSLDAYDTQTFPKNGVTQSDIVISTADLAKALLYLKQELIQKGQATVLFGSEKREGSLEGIVGSVFQTFGGEDLYSSIEEKAAHILYFMVKNHPFNDGNKRSGAFAFVWFLEKYGALSERITPEALTTLTLLIAESDPKDKEKMVGLVLLLFRMASD